MDTLAPKSLAEEVFMAAASTALPEAEIARNDYGTLYYHWKSPSDDIGGLWVYVKEHEVMLSTKISHTHVESHDFWRENLPDDELPKRIAEEGVAQALDILNGETVFIRYFDASGQPSSSSGMWTRKQWIEEKRREGDRTMDRAWNWTGEVTVS